MRRLDGFTLIEIVLAVFILMLLLLLAVPSLNGVLADRRLRQSLDSFNGLVNQARTHAVSEHRSYLLVVGPKSIEVRPEVVTKDDDPEPTAEVPLDKREAVTLTLPAALTRNPPAEWIFWPSGVCEPAVIQVVSPSGVWAANYSALDARPEVTRYVPR